MSTNRGYGEWLTRQLNRRDMSQSDLARKLNTSPSTVSQWARGLRRPEVDSCFAIADQFDLPPGEVMLAAGYPVNTDDDNEEEERVIVLWRKLNPDAKEDVMQYMQFLRRKAAQRE